jgi:hypothetical protein
MRWPKTFLKDKNLEKKVEEYSREVIEDEMPGNFNEEEMTSKICEYVGTYQLLYFHTYQNKIKEQVHDLNYRKPKILGEIKDSMNRLEAELEKYGLEWEHISKDSYNERTYKESKKSIRNYWMKIGFVYYSHVINYLPIKAAKFFIDKSPPELAPTWWDIAGAASYLALLVGETILFNMALGYWWLFTSSAITTGIIQGFSDMNREREMIESEKDFIKRYKKVQGKKEIIKSLKEEKHQIAEFIKERIKTDIF